MSNSMSKNDVEGGSRMSNERVVITKRDYEIA